MNQKFTIKEYLKLNNVFLEYVYNYNKESNYIYDFSVLNVFNVNNHLLIETVSELDSGKTFYIFKHDNYLHLFINDIDDNYNNIYIKTKNINEIIQELEYQLNFFIECL